MRVKVKYTKKIDLTAQLFIEEMKEREGVKEVNTDFFYYHNRKCPGCNKHMPSSGGTLQGEGMDVVVNDYGMFGMILLNEESGIAYLYIICDDCTNICMTNINSDTSTAKMKVLEQNLELNIMKSLGIANLG